MDPAVAARATALNRRFEGVIRWMYLDIKGLVTCGIGCLIDPMDAALPLPWLRKADGKPASQAEIMAEWQHMKAQTSLSHRGADEAGRVATLVLSDAMVDAIAQRKLESNHETLRRRFPDLNDWPTDAQVAIHLMAWAMGPGFPRTWPRFSSACDRRDWIGAAAEAHIPDTGNAGLVPRNAEVRRLLLSAANAAPAERPRVAPPRPAVSPAPSPAARAAPDQNPIKSPGWLEGLVALLRSIFRRA